MRVSRWRGMWVSGGWLGGGVTGHWRGLGGGVMGSKWEAGERGRAEMPMGACSLEM